MINDKIYLTLDDKIKAFDVYCSSQPSCPCKFQNTNCELKWLHEEAVEITHKKE